LSGHAAESQPGYEPQCDSGVVHDATETYRRVQGRRLTAASQWERPFLVDDSKWQGAFGLYQPVLFAEAVERTLTWFRSRQLPR
jgi:hypothetical protein